MAVIDHAVSVRAAVPGINSPVIAPILFIIYDNNALGGIAKPAPSKTPVVIDALGRSRKASRTIMEEERRHERKAQYHAVRPRRIKFCVCDRRSMANTTPPRSAVHSCFHNITASNEFGLMALPPLINRQINWVEIQ
jgi:hypothetical protein